MRIGRLALALLLLAPGAAGEEPTVARELFAEHVAAVAAVRTVEAESGAKRGLGTGFRVGAREIATNYHVVADFVLEPERYRVELVRDEAEGEPLELLGFDVVNDLAILRTERPSAAQLRLHGGELRQGERVFALGNPYDIGMSIVEGTYNGRHRHTRNERIHFTGALNPGMSGGPALLANGEVMGMNVASAGESIAFLVPAARIRALLERVRAPGWEPPEDWHAALRDQLWQYQHLYLEDLFAKPPASVPLGPFRVPSAPAAYFDCWGDRADEDGDRYESLVHYCNTDDWVFISEEHVLAPITFQHRQLAGEALPSPAFFDLYSGFFEGSSSQLAGNDRLFTPFRCHTRFVDSGGQPFKTTFCARAYRELEGLYDVVFKAAALGRSRQGLETSLVLSAVSFENAEQLARRYFAEIQWSE
jgi:hypothetical protein